MISTPTCILWVMASLFALSAAKVPEPAAGEECSHAWREFAAEITNEVHADQVWGGCNSYACQLHLAIQLHTAIERLKARGFYSDEGLPLTAPVVRVSRYCSKSEKQKQSEDTGELLGILRRAVQVRKQVHIVSRELTAASARGFQDIFYVGQNAYNSGDFEGTVAWMIQVVHFLPPSQTRAGPTDQEFPTFRHNDVYDYISAAYNELGDLVEATKYGRAFEATCSKDDPERRRAETNLDWMLGKDSKRRNEAYEGMCDGDVSNAVQISPALPIVSKFGYFSTPDNDVKETFQMRIDNGRSVWASKISRPPGAPNITHLHGLLSEEECNHIMEIAAPMLEDTVVVDPKTGETRTEKYRTSKGCWLGFGENDTVVDRVNIRLAALTQKGIRTHEELHIVHYQVGEEYEPHYDFSDPNRDAEDWTDRGVESSGNREITIIMFLKAPEAGGATVFPISRLSVQPRQGDAIMFSNLNPGGFVDHLTMHGGCPPTKAEKWIATKWIRESNHPEGQGILKGDMGFYA